jgi:DNA-binding NtrC family response regulator
MLNKDVLIVDDEPQMLIAMNETIRRNGYSITTASNGMEAMDRLKEIQYRLVITDLRMPRVTGLDLLREVKSLSPRTQVVMVTAHGTVNNAVEAMKLGAFDYLMKPFSPDELKSIVSRALWKNESYLTVKKAESSFPILTQDPDMLAILELAEQAARGKATVLIQAESGTGKELVARSIHQASPRHQGPFVAVNCAALPENLLEAELFGHEKGAFTGAIMQKQGKFELAHGGTLLLDEIGEMVPLLQAKLLRVLQEQEVDRVGGKRPIPIDVRIIATTNKNLKELVKSGQFREDLYYRLNVIPLTIPPLRARKNDIALLANHFCEKYGLEAQGRKLELANETLDLLKKYDWPGNVRELENVIHRAASLSQSSTIFPRDLFLPDLTSSNPSQCREAQKTCTAGVLNPVEDTSENGAGEQIQLRPGCSVSEMERQLITLTLAETGGNRTHAALMLGISLRTLRNKLREYRLADGGDCGELEKDDSAEAAAN